MFYFTFNVAMGFFHQFAVEEVNRRNLSRLFVPTVDPINPCLILYINRNNIVQESITQIQKAMANDLKKPLKVLILIIIQANTDSSLASLVLFCTTK
jgi:hypothetical protein